MSSLPLKSWRFRLGSILALLLLGLILSLLSPVFLTYSNLINVLRQISINGILAVGVTFVLLTGGVDLSLGSLLALSGVTAACFAHPDSYPTVVPVLAGISVGALCGAWNGLLVTRGRVAPFIVTLGTMTIARGLALLVSQGKPVSNLSREFTWIGGGDPAGIPFPIFIFLGIALISTLFLQSFRWGRYLYAVGGNEKAALVSGIPVVSIKWMAYTLCGAMAGLAGVVLASRITTGQPNAGIGYELDAIAAVVIGGTSLSGGVGSVGGTLLGALLMGVINNGLDLLNVSSYYQAIVKGLIIVGAVWLDQSRKKD